jgi:hypothetical protein
MAVTLPATPSALDNLIDLILVALALMLVRIRARSRQRELQRRVVKRLLCPRGSKTATIQRCDPKVTAVLRP